MFFGTQEAFRRQHSSNIAAILVPSWGHLGPSGGHRGATLGLSWAILGHLGQLEAKDSKHMQTTCVFVTCFLAPRNTSDGEVSGIMGQSWAHLGHQKASNNLRKINIFAVWRVRRATWGYLGPSWGHLGQLEAQDSE